MKEIKELIKNRLKEVLTVPHKDDVDEQLRSHAVKTYISSIIMIEDYMKEEQTNKWFDQQDLIYIVERKHKWKRIVMH